MLECDHSYKNTLFIAILSLSINLLVSHLINLKQPASFCTLKIKIFWKFAEFQVGLTHFLTIRWDFSEVGLEITLTWWDFPM